MASAPFKKRARSLWALFSLLVISGSLFTGCGLDDYEDDDDDYEITPSDDSIINESLGEKGALPEEVSENLTPAGVVPPSSKYADGSYTADGSYNSPGGFDTMMVTLTLSDDVITGVSTTFDASNSDSRSYYKNFSGAIESQVVGVALDELSLSAVAGSSLNTNGFNKAVASIQSQALQ